MYNGIGLRTARGSGTNGFVQRNLSHVNPPNKNERNNTNNTTKKFFKKANQEIVLHEKKRKIESDLFVLKNELIEKGELTEEQIEEQIDQERTKRLSALSSSSKPTTLHEARIAQEQKNIKMEAALLPRKRKQFEKVEEEEEHTTKKAKHV